ncbi:hypothetical protein WR25_10023 [Diploscapter pachys]|uniref:Uncharacterized protein n=1 Tax=Diploscapter pachys TaxID=2018661 RepID=A0A2A2M2V4_9BILA|nr:hypothetical protein WR25_10023 [Diploscapter pachys]
MHRVPVVEALVIVLRREEAALFDPRHDRLGKALRRPQLRDIGARHRGLPRILREDGGAIARPAVRTLPVQLGRIVRDRKIDAKQRRIADDTRIVGHANRLGMAGALGRNLIVSGGRAAAARIAGGDGLDALHPLEHRLHAPETAAREHRGLRGRGGGDINLGGGQRHRAFGGGKAGGGEQGARQSGAGQENFQHGADMVRKPRPSRASGRSGPAHSYPPVRLTAPARSARRPGSAAHAARSPAAASRRRSRRSQTRRGTSRRSGC